MKFDWSKKGREARAAEHANLKEGERVMTWLEWWGEGVVQSNDPARKYRNPATNRMKGAKPLHVVREDGTVGFFHYDQVQRIAKEAN